MIFYNGFWMVWLTVIVAAALSLLPLPDSIAFYRPAWVVMVLVFWNFHLPQHHGLVFAWTLGLGIDILYDSTMGQHAMAMLFAGVAIGPVSRHFRSEQWWQQSVMVFLVVIVYKLTALWIASALGHKAPSLWYFMSALPSALIWPFLAVWLRQFCKRFIAL